MDKKDEPKECAPIQIPSDDPGFSYINATCISMTRTITNKERACSQLLNYNEQVKHKCNLLFIFYSLIYRWPIDSKCWLTRFFLD